MKKDCPKEIEKVSMLKQQARTEIPLKVDEYAKKMGVDYNKITIKSQRTRWGSCSTKGNLNFNCMLMLVPSYVQDYVVVHELAHRKEMNHSERFWNIVESVLPNYKEAKKWLKENGSEIIRQMNL